MAKKKKSVAAKYAAKYANKDVDWHIQKAEKSIRGAMRAKTKGMDVSYAMQEARTHRRLAREKLKKMPAGSAQHEETKARVINELNLAVKKRSQKPMYGKGATVLKPSGEEKFTYPPSRAGIPKRTPTGESTMIAKPQAASAAYERRLRMGSGMPFHHLPGTGAGSTGGGGGTTKGGGRSEAAKKAWQTRKAGKGDTGWRTIKGRKVKVTGKKK